jgi:hypothetical protein
MGWLPTWASTGLGGAAAAPAEPAGPPKREERVRCWDSRDLFFTCLDKHGILDSIKEDKKAREVCAAELQQFEKNCVASWVGYRIRHTRISVYDMLPKQHLAIQLNIVISSLSTQCVNYVRSITLKIEEFPNMKKSNC